jgi:hypothetical protein
MRAVVLVASRCYFGRYVTEDGDGVGTRAICWTRNERYGSEKPGRCDVITADV